MDKIERYREIVRNVIMEYATHKPSHGEIDVSPMIDAERDHYGVLMVGWDQHRRFGGLVILVDIINEKIWIQYDGTQDGVAYDFLEAGVPREDIVLGFRSPRIRQYTEFGTG
jgi:hypothetical protein